MVPSLLLSTLSLPTFRGIPFSPKPTKERKKKNDKLTNLETRVNKMKHFFNVQVHERNQSLLGSGYIRFAPATSCGGGLGMMLSYVRTLLFFSFATNLTYVHTPLTLKFDSRFLSKGVEHGAMDALLGFSWGERCGKQCINDGLNQGNLRRVVYRQKGLLEQQPRHVFSPETSGSLPGLVMANPEPDVVFEVEGCVSMGTVSKRAQRWMLQHFKAACERRAAAVAPAPLLRFDERCWNVAVHYRAGDLLFSPGMSYRLLHPGYYNATLHNLLGALDEYGVPAKYVCVHIFSQGPTQWFRREGFLNMLDGTGASTTLWAGNPNSTVDDILHLARSDVLVMGRSTMSVAVATLSSGVVILNGWDIKYPHEFIHAVPWRRDGSGKRDELLHQLKAADHANGIQQRRRRASEQKV